MLGRRVGGVAPKLALALTSPARALQSVSGTINRACWDWRARALRRYTFWCHSPPHVYPTSTSRDVSDQAFHVLPNDAGARNVIVSETWSRGRRRSIACRGRDREQGQEKGARPPPSRLAARQDHLTYFAAK